MSVSNDTPSRFEGHESDSAQDEMVLCFFSGKMVPRKDAVQVRIAAGRKVWMKAEFCRDG